MNRIMECTYNLIDALDNSDIVKNMEIYKKRIMENEEIRSLIDRGNSASDDDVIREVKEKLYEYSDYVGYMECYMSLKYIVMDINKRMKKIIGNKGCYKI